MGNTPSAFGSTCNEDDGRNRDKSQTTLEISATTPFVNESLSDATVASSLKEKECYHDAKSDAVDDVAAIEGNTDGARELLAENNVISAKQQHSEEPFWRNTIDPQWDEMYEMLKEFKEREINVEAKSLLLSQWAEEQRKAYKRILAGYEDVSLTLQQMAKLAHVGFRFTTRTRRVHVTDTTQEAQIRTCDDTAWEASKKRSATTKPSKSQHCKRAKTMSQSKSNNSFDSTQASLNKRVSNAMPRNESFKRENLCCPPGIDNDKVKSTQTTTSSIRANNIKRKLPVAVRTCQVGAVDKSSGTYSASSMSSTRPGGEIVQYLCIPIKADGTPIPTGGFLSAVPPGDMAFSHHSRTETPWHPRISTAGGTHVEQTNMGRVQFRSESKSSTNLPTFGNHQTTPPCWDVNPCPTTSGAKDNTGTPVARPFSAIIHSPPSYPMTRSRRAIPKKTNTDVASPPERKRIPTTPPMPSRSSDTPADHVLPTPASVNPYFGPPNDEKNESENYKTPATHNSEAGTPMVHSFSVPLNSILELDAMEGVADGTKRIVFARNGTPIAFMGNTMEVLSQSATTPDDLQRKWLRWTDPEDEILRNAVEMEGSPYNWKRISRKYFQGLRSGTQCKNRWKKALQPGLIRGPWTSEEDKIIKESVEKGLRWPEVAKLLPGRIAEQVKERWINAIDPSITREAWTDDELQTLFTAQAEMGNHWKKIAELLPGRSQNQVKNRWHNAKMAQRRKKRKLDAKAEKILRFKDWKKTTPTNR